MSKRRRAREMAVQMLYQSDLGESPAREVIAAFEPPAPAGTAGDAHLRALDYAKTLARGALEHREEIDALIRKQAENWRLERMPAVDRNILRLAVFEFLYEDDVPKLVVLDEAIELAKRFGSEESGRFVNGVLDGLLKTRSFPGRLT